MTLFAKFELGYGEFFVLFVAIKFRSQIGYFKVRSRLFQFIAAGNDGNG